MVSEVTLCTTSQLAARFGVNSSTIRRWVLKKQLVPTITTPGGHHRFDPAAVERLLAHEAPAAEDVPA